MNREILFRGKRVNNGEWVYGYLYIHNGYSGTSALIRGDKILDTEVDIKTIGEYTGLKDKNGKKIFEGDIVKSMLILDNNTLSPNIDTVEFNDEDCSFMLGKGKRHFHDRLDLEVIGNIYDGDNNE